MKFILCIVLGSLLISACGPGQERPTQPSETAPVGMHDAQSPTPLPTDTSEPSQEATTTSSIVTLDPCGSTTSPDLSTMTLLFVANWDGDEEIYQIQASGDKLAKLTNNSVEDILPEWSPDGEKIAYLSKDASTGMFRLFSMNPEGSQVTQKISDNLSIGISSHPASGEHQKIDPNITYLPIRWVAWAPDSQHIAFRGTDGEGSFIMVSDVSDSRPIAIEGDFWVNPSYSISWSPDGQLIAFDAPVDVSTLWSRVHIVRPDGSKLQTIYSDVVEESKAQWHPFNQELLVISNSLGTGREQLYLMKPDGTDRRALTDTDNVKIWASWSPNGQMIAYGAVIINEYLNPLNSGMYIIDNQGKLLQTIAEETGVDDFHFSWAPDNHHLAFLIKKDNVSNLYIADICGGEISLLKENISAYTPSWKPRVISTH